VILTIFSNQIPCSPVLYQKVLWELPFLIFLTYCDVPLFNSGCSWSFRAPKLFVTPSLYFIKPAKKIIAEKGESQIGVKFIARIKDIL
jgi:hypothetical protein